MSISSLSPGPFYGLDIRQLNSQSALNRRDNIQPPKPVKQLKE